MIKDMAGMEKDMQRRRSESRPGSSRPNGKRPTNSPTSRSSSKTLRMDEEGDWLQDLENDENQNKGPNGRVEPNRSNGV